MDLAKLKELYQPGSDDFVLIDVPEMTFAMIDGEGSPDNGAGADAIKKLYTAIYPVRREARERYGRSFVEPPVEMLYWADNMADLVSGNKDNWKWRVMIVLPEFVNNEIFANSVEQAREQLGETPDTLRMEAFTEGRSAQIMHVGLQQDIPALLAKLYTEFLPQNRIEPAGYYHEIYLDDWSRIAPEKRRVVLRQPVRALDQ